MMGEWSGSGGDNEEGVSAEVAFSQFDRDGSGTIDASELALLLQELGATIYDEYYILQNVCVMTCIFYRCGDVRRTPS